MTGSFPFLSREQEDLIQKVETGIFRIKRDTQITPICLDFINRCLRYDPEKRINWE
jgi:serine/threonine protein kinase